MQAYGIAVTVAFRPCWWLTFRSQRERKEKEKRRKREEREKREEKKKKGRKERNRTGLHRCACGEGS